MMEGGKMEAKLEKLQSAMMSVMHCERSGDLMSLPINESRLMDAAIACGASLEEPDYLVWAAMRLTDWLVSS